MVYELKLGDCTKLMKDIPSKSIDCILTDPPYLYLKNQEIDAEFNEDIFFSEVERILKDDGFIAIFGRGSSFYRWNTILDSLGFNFKEEIIWQKQPTSPFSFIGRVHETVSLHSKKGNIRKIKVPYIQQKDIKTIIQDINRLKTVLTNLSELDDVQNYLETGIVNLQKMYSPKYSTTISSTLKSSPRSVSVVKSMKEGMIEQDIIHVARVNYNSVHPTQKPIELLERILNVCSDENFTVLDPFMGSGSTGVACVNTNRNFIGFEILDKYFDIAKNRIDESISEKLSNPLKYNFSHDSRTISAKAKAERRRHQKSH